MNTTDGIYADFRKVEQGMKLYMKLSQPVAYATIKLIQFLARAVKENFFDKDMVENFTKFAKATNGEFSIYRMPYMNELTREQAVENAKNYLDKAGIKYCVMDSVNDNDKALHISVARKDEQKFNVMFTDYLKAQLSGGEKTADDLINLTDGKTTIISIPDAALDTMKNALTEINVNFAELPDLVPGDGEKQLRIASVDLNLTKQCYEAYRRSVMKTQPEGASKDAAPDMKIFSEEDYLDTARESPEQYMESSVSDELKEKLQEYEKLERKFPNYFFATIPGTKGEQILMLPKNQVFKVNDADRDRFVAFVNNQRKAKVFYSNGDIDTKGLYPTGKDLFKKFDRHDAKGMDMQKDLNKSVTSAFENVVPKAAPVK